MNYELIGYLAGALVAGALIPQVLKSWKTKSTKDISLLWNSTLLTGLVLWVVYGYGIGSMPLLIFATIEASLSLSLLVLKLTYK